MAVVINTNSAATLASANLAASGQMLQKSLNRLSSGSKIVSPADDAGGLAVSMKLSAAAKRQAATAANVGNAVSYLQTQDGVLKATGKVLERISELKTLNADPTKNTSDLANYQAEFSKLQAQLTAMAAEKFNGVSLFGSNSLNVPTTEDGATNLTVDGVGLLSGGGPSVVNFSVGLASMIPYTPSGPETLTVTSGGITLYKADQSVGYFMVNGDTATYDGAGSWTLTRASSGTTTVATTAVHMGPNLLPSQAGTVSIATSGGSSTNTGTVATATDLSSLGLATVTDAIADIATHRATNGANQSRLGFAAELLTVNKANLEAANSRIVDVDVAEESTQMARYNILVQAGTAMLSQANQSSQAALRLIG